MKTIVLAILKRPINHFAGNGVRSRHSVRALFIAVVMFSYASIGCTGVGQPEGWSAAVVDDAKAYIGTMDGDFRAIDLETGATIWKYDLPGDENRRAVYGSPALYSGAVFFGGYDGVLYAVDQNGELLWDREVGDASPIVGGTTVDQGRVLVGSSDGGLYSFDADNGSLEWSFFTEGKIWSTPTVADGVVYFGSLDHKLYALGVEDGEELWSFQTNGAVTAKPLVVDGKVYIGSFSSIFYAVDAKTGIEDWRFEGAGNWFWGGAISANGNVFAPSLDGNIYALRGQSGDLLWSLSTGGPVIGSPGIVSDRLVSASTDGRVRLVDLADGTDVRSCDIGSRIRSSITVHDEVILVSATDHSIRALAATASGADEKWAHFSNRESPVATGEEKAC